MSNRRFPSCLSPLFQLHKQGLEQILTFENYRLIHLQMNQNLCVTVNKTSFYMTGFALNRTRDEGQFTNCLLDGDTAH